ncbi:hypothetical protein BLA24_21375 [Streptomyces cinnamoneus]|uniref:Uncharacterized protein n=1 Tax=Streptomyces cinnamoneus TaxID=53446 RepID=A0A2G1XFX3_STRCJ|nr:hypothetical protein [Streptomyces cinnamoneus]PHQ50138.1 hypothetical protein BLA24_21375 [Streptomyces cinnamoneus]PPT13081.1 hypothetical protein CYQ11_09410 [Streptomyces cinnamoneus]
MRFGGALLVLGGLVLGTFGAGVSAYSSGALGTRGTFTVERCEHRSTTQRGGGRGADGVDCTGSFRPAGGGGARQGLSVDREYEAGRRVDVSCAFADTCYEIDRVNASGWFAGFLAALAMVCLGGPGVVRGATWRTERYERGRAIQRRLVKGLLWPAAGLLAGCVLLRLAL